MTYRLLTFFFSLTVLLSNSQDVKVLSKLNNKIYNANNSTEKIESLIKLADYYSFFKLNTKADSVLQIALSKAELSHDTNLVLKSLFLNINENLSSWNNKVSFEKIINYFKKGLEYSEDLNRNDFTAIAYLRLANIYRIRGLYNDALQYTSKASSVLFNTNADSIQCAISIELGEIFLNKEDVVNSYKNYINAFTIAYKLQNFSLQSEIYHHLSSLYETIGDDKLAKRSLDESLKINEYHSIKPGLLLDYIDLARLTDDTNYINKAYFIANNLNNENLKEYCKRLMFSWYMVKMKNYKLTLSYYYNNPTLDQYYKNQGSSNYNWNIGNIYFYGEKFDSAYKYYKLAENELTSNYDDNDKLYILTNLAEASKQNHKIFESKKYYQNAYYISKNAKNTSFFTSISDSLSKLYKILLDFKAAYFYDQQADSGRIILNNNSAKDKVVLLKIEMESKKHESDLLEIEKRKTRNYNLQIMAITFLVAIIFSLMIFIGMFNVTKASIKMLGYFAFISLFEFILLLIDPMISKFTNHEPLKIWAIKILLIAILVPIQHFLEHNLIIFLSSRKLLEARLKFSFKKLFKKENKNVTSSNNIEEDSAVL